MTADPLQNSVGPFGVIVIDGLSKTVTVVPEEVPIQLFSFFISTVYVHEVVAMYEEVVSPIIGEPFLLHK